MTLFVVLAVLAYLIPALGIIRWDLPRQYEKLRVPVNGTQMSEDAARSEAMRAAAATGFTWPILAAAGTLLVPLVVVFDVAPAVAKAGGRAVASGAGALAPALGPVTGWVAKPLEQAVVRDRQLSLAARADEPVDDTPLIPDEISTWTDPRTRGVAFAHSELDRAIRELDVHILDGYGRIIREDKRRIRREEA